MTARQQTTRHLLMVRPAAFGPNEQTADSNRFQQPDRRLADTLQAAACDEFERMVAQLHAAGVQVVVCEDTPSPVKPDAVFPNNWMSTHASGAVILYPLAAPNRRAERRADLVAALEHTMEFTVAGVTDLSACELDGLYLEGTGSLVLDRINRVAYAGLSARTSELAVQKFAASTGYQTHVFSTCDATGLPVYHTNVLLSIGSDFVVICPAVMDSRSARETLIEKLRSTQREIIEISAQQMTAFAGNILEVRGARDAPVIVLSQSAADALDADQRARLARHGELLPVDIGTIERVGGGSARCMLLEIFLPPGRRSAGQLPGNV